MGIENTVSSDFGPRMSIVKGVLDCPPIRCSPEDSSLHLCLLWNFESILLSTDDVFYNQRFQTVKYFGEYQFSFRPGPRWAGKGSTVRSRCFA